MMTELIDTVLELRGWRCQRIARFLRSAFERKYTCME